MRTTTIYEFLESLQRENRHATAECYQLGLMNLQQWLAMRKANPLKVTRQSLEAFQRWLSEEYRSPNGRRLAIGTQAARIAAVKSFYGWLHRNGKILVDPARGLLSPKVPRSRSVTADYLTQQEAMALLQTQAEWMREARSEKIS